MPESKTVTFVQSKSTKGCFVYDEQPPVGTAPIIGTLYVKRYAFGDIKSLEVTVTPKG